MGSPLENIWQLYSPATQQEKVATRAITGSDFSENPGPLTPDGEFQMVIATAREVIRLSHTLYPGPYSLDQLSAVKIESTTYIYKLFHKAIFSPHTGLIDETFLPRWILENSGIISKKETDLIWDLLVDKQIGEIRTHNDITRLTTDFSAHHISSSEPDAKIITLDQAVPVIEKLRLQGHRTVGIFGGFNYGTVGHTNSLKEAALVAGKHGRIIVFVNGDQEMTFTRGNGRPYYKQESRLNNVASNSAVDLAVGLEWVGDNLESEKAYYQQLQEALALQFRYIGERDNRYELFHEQCDSAGTILVYSEKPRFDHATEVIAASKSI